MVHSIIFLINDGWLRNNFVSSVSIRNIIGAKVVAILGKVIKSAIIEKASIDEVYLDVTEEATRRLNAMKDNQLAFTAVINQARASSLAGEDAVEMQMTKNTLRKGHSGTKKEGEGELEGGNIRDWFDQPNFMWNQDDKLLLFGAIICDELRSEVLKQLNYSCSGGVAHNKMLSKIASAMHKPNKQTLVPSCAVQNMMTCLPISRVAGFGGKLGDSLADFGGRKIEKFSDIIEIGKAELSATFGEETTVWMLNAAAGIDHTPVEQRALTASIGCGKSYRQKNTLPPAALQDGRVLHWLRELSEELEERVQMDTAMHSRKPKQITVGLSIAYVVPPKPPGDTTDPVKKWHDSQGMSLSKVGPMCVGAVAVSKAAHAMAVRAVADSTRLNKPWNITYISLSASGFVPVANESQAISSFFKQAPSPSKIACRSHLSGSVGSDVRTSSSSSSGSQRHSNSCDPRILLNTTSAGSDDLETTSVSNQSTVHSSVVAATDYSSITGDNEEMVTANIGQPPPTTHQHEHQHRNDVSGGAVVLGSGSTSNATHCEKSGKTADHFYADDDDDDGEDSGIGDLREISTYYSNRSLQNTYTGRREENNPQCRPVESSDVVTVSVTKPLTDMESDHVTRVCDNDVSGSAADVKRQRGSACDDLKGSDDSGRIPSPFMGNIVNGDVASDERETHSSDRDHNDDSDGDSQGRTSNSNDNNDIGHIGTNNSSSSSGNSNHKDNISAHEIDMDVFNALPIAMQRELSTAFQIPFKSSPLPEAKKFIPKIVSIPKGQKNTAKNVRVIPDKNASSVSITSFLGGTVGDGGVLSLDDDDDEIQFLDDRYSSFCSITTSRLFALPIYVCSRT